MMSQARKIELTLTETIKFYQESFLKLTFKNQVKK